MSEQMAKSVATDGTEMGSLTGFLDFHAFAELAIRNLVLTLEYNTVNAHIAVNGTTIGGLQAEAFYAMANYRFTDWFAMGLYGAGYYSDRHDRSNSDPSKRQYDGALSFRFDINQYMLVKFEGHYLDGTALVLADLNPDSTILDTHGLAFLTRATFVF